MGGFTPHYSPPMDPFQPPFSSQYPPHQTQYDGMPQPFMGNFQPPPMPPGPNNPSHPQSPNYYTPQNMNMDDMPPRMSSMDLRSISSMTAVERSRQLKFANTTPHLQLMVGPLLRYDTIENGIWRGAALVVSECAYLRLRMPSPRARFITLAHPHTASDAGSYYDPPPALRFYYDHSLPTPKFRRSTHLHRAPSRATPPKRTPSSSHQSLQRSMSSNGTAPGSPIQDAFGNISEASPSTQAVAVTGQEIWVYCGSGG